MGEQEKMNTLLLAFMQDVHIQIKRCLDETHPAYWKENGSKKNYDMWILLSGSVQIEYRGTEYILMPGDIFLFYPHLVYRARVIEENYHLIYIHFDASISGEKDALNSFSFDGKIPSYITKREKEVFLDSFIDFKRGKLVSPLHLGGAFNLLLARVFEYQCENKNETLVKADNKAERLSPVFSYISENIHQRIRIGDLAVLVGMSEKYFITFFRNTTGTTPFRYITDFKMKKALSYLKEKKYSVKEVAVMMGYDDPYTFSKAFKRKNHISPSRV